MSSSSIYTGPEPRLRLAGPPATLFTFAAGAAHAAAELTLGSLACRRRACVH
jgi:hypothetical protein